MQIFRWESAFLSTDCSIFAIPTKSSVCRWQPTQNSKGRCEHSGTIVLVCERSVLPRRRQLCASFKIGLLFAGAAVTVDVLPRFLHSVLIVGHQMKFIFDIGVMMRLEQLGTGFTHLPD
jgi:hypothetical protein